MSIERNQRFAERRFKEHMENGGPTTHWNPWLTIPASDYEGHMGSAKVGQLPVLNRIFADALAEFAPRHLAVAGCSTGNGFEHIDLDVTRRIVSIDINPDYLDVLDRRYRHRIPGLELVCADLASCSLEPCSLDLIHAALVFEYLAPEDVLPEFTRWLRAGGILTVVLQLPSPTSKMVSETPYTSLRALGSIMRLVDPVVFCKLAGECGLATLRSWDVDLKLGKRFRVVYYKKIGESYPSIC
jgi:SAM-dependent methyltransferase